MNRNRPYLYIIYNKNFLLNEPIYAVVNYNYKYIFNIVFINLYKLKIYKNTINIYTND